jgi:hypothetical protein
MKNVLVIVVLVICAIILLPLCNKEPEKQQTIISMAELNNEIKSIKELAVLEQDYKLLVKNSKDKCLLGKHGCSTASFSAVCDYTMKIGFDFDKVKITGEGNRLLVVRYPHAKILSPGSRENCQEYEWKNGLWSKLNIDYFNEIKGKLEEEETKYIKEHFQKHDEAATDQLKKLIMNRLRHVIKHGYNAEIIEKEYQAEHLASAPYYIVKFIQED